MKLIIVAVAAVVLPILIGSGAPANNTNEIKEEIIELRRNLSLVWELLEDIRVRMGYMENQDVIDRLKPCDELEKMLSDGGQVPKTFDGEEEEDEKDENEEEDDDDEKDDKTKTIKDEKEKKSDIQKKEDSDDEKHKEKCQNQSRYYQQYHQPPPPRYETQNNVSNIKAYCGLRPNKALPPNKRLDIRGKIFLTEKNSNKLVVSILLSGLLPTKTSMTNSQSLKHGFHVHELGNLNNGCESAGPHFNPFNMTHGAPYSSQRHRGDLGNIETDSFGNLNTTLEFNIQEPLSAPSHLSFIGRTLIIHEKVDDLGSNPSNEDSRATGNSGTRLACCVIYKLDST